MERNITTRAVVIGTAPFGELHRSVRLLSGDLGIINAIVYGGRKGKKTALAPLFSYGTYNLYFNPLNNEYSLKDESTSFSPSGLMADIKLNCAASYFCEVSSKLESQDYSEVFPLLCSALRVLDTNPDLINRVIIAFTWKLLILSGIQSDLIHCPICDKTYKEDEILHFSTTLNAPVCHSCADVEYPVLMPGCRRYLRFTADKSFLDMLEVELFEDSEKKIRDYLLSYIKCFCNGRLKTLESGLLDKKW